MHSFGSNFVKCILFGWLFSSLCCCNTTKASSVTHPSTNGRLFNILNPTSSCFPVIFLDGIGLSVFYHNNHIIDTICFLSMVWTTCWERSWQSDVDDRGNDDRTEEQAGHPTYCTKYCLNSILQQFSIYLGRRAFTHCDKGRSGWKSWTTIIIVCSS